MENDEEVTGKLYVIATPIGNMEDITLRALRTLTEIEVLASEDTRHTRQIFVRNNIALPPLYFPYHERNEGSAAVRILSLLAEGKQVGLTSNAGYPGISDPGYVIISKAIEQGYQVEVIPGASTVPIALLKSGLSTSSYTFKGFPPRKPGKRGTFIAMERDLPHTMIYFESPHRVGVFLKQAYEVLGNRQAAVCVELTKVFEQVTRGYLSDLAEKFATAKIKGEVAVVIAGNNPKFARDEENDDEDEE